MSECRVYRDGQYLDPDSFDGPTDEEVSAAYQRMKKAHRAKCTGARAEPDRARASSIVFAVGTPRLGKYGRGRIR